MDNPFKSPAILSVCTGMRGLERGIERAIGPIRTIAYVEIEAFVIENLVQQMEQGVLAPAPVWSNVKTFPWKQFYGKLHWIIGGYPCQPFSHAGLRAGTNDPRHLWPFIKSGVKKSRPMGVYFENVEGHLSLGLRDVLADLRKLGYQTEVGLFSAAEVVAPHRRNRIFILGLENSFLLGNGRRYIEDFIRRCEIQAQGSGVVANPGYCRYGHECELRTSLEQTKGPEELLSRGELANCESLRCESQWPESERLKRSAIANNDGMGNSSIVDVGASTRKYEEVESGGSGMDNPAESRCETECGFQSESGLQFPVSGSEGVGISDAFSKRLAQRKEQSARKEQQAIERSDLQDRWPARPGQPQHEWEAPRVESSMGYTINGYNYREDLLRMAGNAVVEQTAEVAFKTLLRKFLK